MNSSDPFQILGLQPGAPSDEVRRAYRKLAMRWHPDRNQHSKVSEERFKLIKSAYEIASDAAAYKAWRANAAAAAATARAKQGPKHEPKQEPKHEPKQEAKPPPREDVAPIEQTLALTLEEVAAGGRRTIHVDRSVACVACTGRGRVDHDHSLPCQHCQGVGRRRSTGLGAAERCDACAGRGYVRHIDCKACHGRGNTVRRTVFEVQVPVGMRHGETLRLARAGGSILLNIEHLPHPIFSLQGNDLHCNVPVDVLAMIAGGEIEVPTLDSVIRIPLPAASLTTEFRLAKKGFPKRHGRGAGDLVLHLQAVFPKNLSAAELAQVKQLAATVAKHAASRTPELHAWQGRLDERKVR